MKILFLALSLFCVHSVWADIHKCTDSQGKTTYQNSPCAIVNNAEVINTLTGTRKEVVDRAALQRAELEAKEKKRQEIELQKLQQEQEKERLLQEGEQESKKNQELIGNNREKYSPYSIPPYSLKRAPEIALGFLARLPEIERLRRVVSEQALSSGECDRVEASELDLKSRLDDLRFWVDCSNGKRIQFNEKELGQGDNQNEKNE